MLRKLDRVIYSPPGADDLYRKEAPRGTVEAVNYSGDAKVRWDFGAVYWHSKDYIMKE